jgi:hypothetical protein
MGRSASNILLPQITRFAAAKENAVSYRPTRAKYAILQQMCQLIPAHLVPKLARESGVDKRARTFSPWSHVLALLYAQLAHAISLNDVCDALRNHGAKLFSIRRATAPRRNTLSHANRNRDANMAERLFWEMLDHLAQQCPKFAGQTYKGMPRRFKRAIRVVDSSTIKLVANCIDWARHQRRKAAAKLHLQLDLQSFLPRFAIVDTARRSDPSHARELCANLAEGEIVVFDKAYVDFVHLSDLDARGVSWVTRAKTNMDYRYVKQRPKAPSPAIVRDDLIRLTGRRTREKYRPLLRRVVARVEVDGKETELTFITNNLEWAASSIADLYKSRWAIEVFFKELKQTVQLCDFIGHNKNAILWQVWIALLLHLLLRYLSFVHDWSHSFLRLSCVLRSAIWDQFALVALLKSCGTAGGVLAIAAVPSQAYFPGFAPI